MIWNAYISFNFTSISYLLLQFLNDYCTFGHDICKCEMSLLPITYIFDVYKSIFFSTKPVRFFFLFVCFFKTLLYFSNNICEYEMSLLPIIYIFDVYKSFFFPTKHVQNRTLLCFSFKERT